MRGREKSWGEGGRDLGMSIHVNTVEFYEQKSCYLDRSGRESCVDWKACWGFQPQRLRTLSGSVYPTGSGTVGTSISQNLMHIRVHWDHAKMQVLAQSPECNLG